MSSPSSSNLGGDRYAASQRVPHEVGRTICNLANSALRLAKRARKVDELRWHTVTSFAELLRGELPSVLWLYAPAALEPNRRVLFPELTNEEIRADHFRSPPTATGVGLACLCDALVSGSSLVGSSSVIYRLGPVAPLYVDEYLSRAPLSNDPPVGNRRLVRRTKRSIQGLCVLLTHWNSGVYGHWLLENMPKLLLLRQISNDLPNPRIVVPRGLPEWVTNWVSFILPGSSLERYDERTEYLQCDRLLMPTVFMHPEHFFHPALRSLLDRLCRSVSADPGRQLKLYVTRVTPSRFRKLANQAEIEAVAVEEGFTLVAPETLSIADQIEVFAAADVIVGEFGSAIHNALFSPPHSRVLCLNWINGMQSRIAQLKAHEVGYLLPSDGAAVKYAAGASRVDYHIDAQSFRRCLRTMI